MTAIRTRLADALREHRLFNARCEGCGEAAKYESLHQVDVLLSLPGIAIVEMDANDLKRAAQMIGTYRTGEADELAAVLLAAADGSGVTW